MYSWVDMNLHSEVWFCIRSVQNNCEAVPLRGRGDPVGCATSRLPYFLQNRLTYGGGIINLTRRQLFTLKKIPGVHFWRRVSRQQRHSAAGRVRLVGADIKKTHE